jgi:hypothetical protein
MVRFLVNQSNLPYSGIMRKFLRNFSDAKTLRNNYENKTLIEANSPFPVVLTSLSIGRYAG